MQEAVARLLERQDNLDKQWLRALVLDLQGIWVGDDDGGSTHAVRGFLGDDDENEKRGIVLSFQARRHSGQNFQKYSKEQCEILEMYVRVVNHKCIGSNPPPLVRAEAEVGNGLDGFVHCMKQCELMKMYVRFISYEYIGSNARIPERLVRMEPHRGGRSPAGGGAPAKDEPPRGSRPPTPPPPPRGRAPAKEEPKGNRRKQGGERG